MADKTKQGKTPIKNAILKSTATVTALDHRTVGDMDRAIAVLNSKIEKGNLSEKTRKMTEKQVQRLQTQKEKTLKLYRKYKKDSRLQSMSSSAASVYEIWRRLGRDTKEITSDGQAFGKWALQNGGENAIAMLGSGIAIAGLLRTNISETATIGSTIWNFLTDPQGPLWKFIMADPGRAIALGGAGVLAAIMVKKGIRKKLEQQAAARQEAEDEMNKGTVRDHEALAKALPGSAAFKNLVASAATNESDYAILFQIASDPNNNPDTIANANKILSAARAQIKASATQSLQAALSAHMNSGNALPSDSDKTIKSAIENQALFEEIIELKGAANATIATTSISDTKLKGKVDAENTKSAADRANSIKGKDAAAYVVAVIGDRPAPTYDDSTPPKITNQAAIDNYDEAAKVVKQIYNKTTAQVEYDEREAAGEFTVDATDPTKYTVNGVDFSTNPAAKTQGKADYYEALREACQNTGIDVSTLTDDQIASKYATIIDQIKNGMLAERTAERTGMVK